MRCPVCDSFEIHNIVTLKNLPYSVIELRSSAAESVSLPKYPINIVECDTCGHVFNSAYNELNQPGGCTMYNSGIGWKSHMENVAALAERLAKGRLIVEVGAGTGEFAKYFQTKEYIAYEPSEDSAKCAEVCQTHCDYFHPEVSFAFEKPGLVVLRHVLEHFANPRGFLEDMAAAARANNHYPDLLIEVPNIENALQRSRIEDWVYEHPQHFTASSLKRLLSISGWQRNGLTRVYNKEVLVAWATPIKQPRISSRYFEKYRVIFNGLRIVRREILAAKTALWGGAGKGANLINLLELPTDKVLVVDSDSRKVGKYVPGTAHKICSPEQLEDYAPDMTVVTTSWRATDIMKECVRKSINPGTLMVVESGALRKFQG